MIRDNSVIKGKITASVLGPDGKVKRWSMSVVRQYFSNKIEYNANSRKSIFMKILSGIIIAITSIYYSVRYAIFSSPMISVCHNIITDQGDALIADCMSQTPARTKVDNTHGYIEVGTAYSATGAKAQTGCHTPSGSRKVMSSTYPKQKGTWGNTDDNVVQYRCLFAAGDLNATINEASIHNASTSGDCLCYGAVSPNAVVSSADTLQIDWEHTYLGA
jgi:hypothetical protein